MSEPSTKPYLIRAIFDWCADAGYTPYLAVQVDEYTQVPMAYVKDGKIVLNIGMDAVRNLQLGNEDITCGGRFGGVAHQLRPDAVQVGFQIPGGDFADRHHAVFAALALAYPYRHSLAVNIGYLQTGCFAYPQPGRICEHQDRLVLKIPGNRKEGFNL